MGVPQMGAWVHKGGPAILGCLLSLFQEGEGLPCFRLLKSLARHVLIVPGPLAWQA